MPRPLRSAFADLNEYIGELSVKGKHNSMDMKQYSSPSMGCNGYLVKAPRGYVAVDAPEGFAAWVRKVLPADAKLTDLLITHQHFDHVADAAALQEMSGCTVHACMTYSQELTLELLAGGAWGVPPVPPFRVDEVFGTAPQQADWGGLAWDVYPIPGHAPDGVAYGLKAEGVVFVGDILFAGAIGRTDFPGGSTGRLVAGIRKHLMPLPPATRVFPGHGPETSIAEESLNNPYL